MSRSWASFLEDTFTSYAEMAAIPIVECDEPLVPLGSDHSVATHPINNDMLPYTGNTIWVRSGVAEKLAQAQAFLAEMKPGAQLEVVYGYRHLAIQTRSFEEAMTRAAASHPGVGPLKLREIAPRSIAAPDVAGYPTGGAVDIRFFTPLGQADMGTEAHDFSVESYTHAPTVGKNVWRNRQLLRTAMMKAGFAPFDGEWWHFSHGDREWAVYYNRPNAIYRQLVFPKAKMT